MSTFGMMEDILIYFVIGLFVALLVVNFYFRLKVFKLYNKLVRNRVQFTARTLLNREKLAKEVVPRYPEHEEDILAFSDHIRFSMRLGVALVTLITLLGGVLMYFR